ncbi:hypothetical protein C5748_24115 [Phyllobacterium phragmitis]|uniref:Uncharacterized protein n=1 Tax=Phyllobacterium phragmitis TaxID=2670329 RepID=A0A2S9IK92_9HYPH|nr:hypothetical protein C5748_24115 [Phyllobacterium phragmitis]
MRTAIYADARHFGAIPAIAGTDMRVGAYGCCIFSGKFRGIHDRRNNCISLSIFCCIRQVVAPYRPGLGD